ncbi:hypothetical protein MMC11_006439 [Xylographa trunciseda]|nr:hypothetical protein [Xylographa trunciseda]
MAANTVQELIGQPFPIASPEEDESLSPTPFIIYDDTAAPPEYDNEENTNQLYFPRRQNPAGPYIAPDGTVEARPSPEEATQWFPDDEVSLRVADRDLRAMVDRILLNLERQSPCARYLACAIVKHFSFWLWLLKDKHHPFEFHMTTWISLVLKEYLQKAMRPTGLTETEERHCSQLEAFMTTQIFANFPELCEWATDKNWATLAKLVDSQTDEPVVMEIDPIWGGDIRLRIDAIRYVLKKDWIDLEFLCNEKFFPVPYKLIMVWEAQNNRLKNLSRNCERILEKVENREARILQEVSGNAGPDPDRRVWFEGKENQPPVEERRMGDGEDSFPEWQERMLRRLAR